MVFCSEFLAFHGPLHAIYLLDAFDIEDFLDQVIKQGDIIHADDQHAFKQASLGLDVDASQ